MRREKRHSMVQTEFTRRPTDRWCVRAGVVCALAMVSLALGATTATADNWFQRWDVVCGSGVTLKTATGVPRGATHVYEFGGVCSLRAIYQAGPDVLAHPPVVADAKWEAGSQTYTESIHALAPMSGSIKNPAEGSASGPFYSAEDWKIGTGSEVATFRCDTDPVLARSAHCTLVSSRNGTGFGSQSDGFAHAAAENKPLLLGLVSEAQAAQLSQSRAFPPITCADLQLTGATGVSYGNSHTYALSGTCMLYQDEFGDQGRQVTRVSTKGTWDGGSYRATQSVNVLVAAAKGGGTWDVQYTCSADPWLNRQAQCSRTSLRGPHLAVYDPITDLFAVRPLGAPVEQARAKQLSERAAPKRLVAPITKSARVVRQYTPPKPKLVIEIANPEVTKSCTSHGMIDLGVEIRNEGGTLPAHTQLAYVYASESGGADLTSDYVGLPEILQGHTWEGTLHVGTDAAHLSELPGSHVLTVITGPSNALASSMDYVQSPPKRVTVTLPPGYCEPNHRLAVPGMMKPKASGG